MTNYYGYTTDFTLSIDEDIEEFTTIELEICLKQTYAGCSAKLSGPPEECYPAEGPEWEYDSFTLLFGKMHKLKISEEDCVALFGQKFFDKHYELAEEAANEQELQQNLLDSMNDHNALYYYKVKERGLL